MMREEAGLVGVAAYVRTPASLAHEMYESYGELPCFFSPSHPCKSFLFTLQIVLAYGEDTTDSCVMKRIMNVIRGRTCLVVTVSPLRWRLCLGGDVRP